MFRTIFLLCLAFHWGTGAAGQSSPRLLITTDIGGDPDDTQSLIRLLVTSSEFDLEGLVASASGTPGELDTAVVRTDLILDLIDSYGSVYPGLVKHHPAFPAPSRLREIVKAGNPMRGAAAIGDGKDTEGSRWIEERIMDPGARPLNICIWGGQTDTYQALHDLRRRLGREQFRASIEKVKIYSIDDQDGLYEQLRSDFPTLFHILARSRPNTDKREAVYRGMYLGGDESLTSREWVEDHVRTGHGPLGALYPVKAWTAPNPHGCLKEGDTPSWFYFLDNGLQDPSHPGYGGWGGRFRKDSGNYFVDARDGVDTVESARATVWRWRQAYQNDFAARMDWCVKDPGQTNHHPVAVVNGDSSRNILYLEMPAREPLVLDAGGSHDPDGDGLSYSWWIYREPSGGKTIAPLHHPAEHITVIDPAAVPGNGEIHLILEVRDGGIPSLVSSRRLVISPGP